MVKKQVSARLPEKMVDYIDSVSENRTNFLAKAVIKMMDDPELIEAQIEQKKQERDSLIEKKHEVEKEIEASRDEIRELEQMKTEAKTIKRVRDKIPKKEMNRVRDTVRTNKYDSDPRSADPQQVIDHNADRFADKYDIEKKEVVKVLRITTEV